MMVAGSRHLAFKVFPRKTELTSRFPGGPFVAIGDGPADLEKEAEVFHGAGEVPVGFDGIRDLVIIVRRVVVQFLEAEAGGFADVVRAGLNIEHWDAHFREFALVGAVRVAAEVRVPVVYIKRSAEETAELQS